MENEEASTKAMWMATWRLVAMVNKPDRQWVFFLDTLAKTMSRFETDQKFSMEEAFEPLRAFEENIDPEIVEFAYNTISEIDGFPTGYSEVRMLAEKKVSIDDFKKYMME